MLQSRRAQFFTDEKGAAIGVCLSAEFDSAHEDGFGSPYSFGVTDKVTKERHGLARITNTKVPKWFRFEQFGDIAYLYDIYHANERPYPEEGLRSIVGVPTEYNPLVGAWDDECFAVGAHGAEGIAVLKSLYDAAHRNDLAFMMTGDIASALFGAVGPTFVIASKAPESVRKNVLEHDQRELQEAA